MSARAARPEAFFRIGPVGGDRLLIALLGRLITVDPPFGAAAVPAALFLPGVDQIWRLVYE
jgi:hypothetical protein